ncbi:MAG: nuclear transport factor 2 family protein [Actinomycetota bacterium]|nr:nuclear transport factor 2 family protein [Actinomycetota bacterium]
MSNLDQLSFYIISTTNGVIMSGNDKVDIIDVLNLYGVALDARRFDLFDRIFTADVHAEFGPAGTGWTDLPEFKRGFESFHKTLDSHQHTMTGHVVNVDGDRATAFSYGNWLLIRNSAEGGPVWEGTGWYDDELVRTDRGWLISRRICRLMSWSGNPTVPQPNGDQAPDHGLNKLWQAHDAGEIAFLNSLPKD